MTSEAAVATWPLVKLRDVTADVRSWNPLEEPEFTYVDISSIDNERCEIVDPKRLPGSQAPSRARRPIQDGDVVFSNVRTYLRNVAQVSDLVPPAVASTGFTVLRPTADLESRFLYHFARSDYFISQVTPEQTGTHYPATSDRVVRDRSIPLPDIETQRALVALIDHLEKARKSSVAHLRRARRAVERFRQAALAAACSGRLTADWRDSKSTSAVGLVDALRAAATTRRRPVATPDASLAVESPESWCLITLDLLVDHIEAGRSFNALGRPAQVDEWGVVKVSAMSWGRFLQDENKAIPTDRTINPTNEIRPGDLLISRANTADLVGATVLVTDTRPRLLLSDKSLRLITRAGVDKAWLNLVLRSPAVRRQFADRATGTSDSMRNLSQPKILATTLCLPPTDEQYEIARRATQFMDFADDLLRRVGTAEQRIERSSQTVLAKAFQGELTPLPSVGH